MTTKNKNIGRPPVGGYGVESVKLTTTIRLPKSLHKWLLKVSGSKAAEFIRDLLHAEKERTTNV
jgi:hypothetical protein